MKKAIYLLAMIFTLALMSTSCDPTDDPINDDPEPQGIVAADIVGDWEFASLEFEGDVYVFCNDSLNELYDFVTLYVYGVTETNLTLFSDCVDNDIDFEMGYSYTIENNIIYLEDNAYTFEILNAEEFNGNTLVLELIDRAGANVPVGGVYTLVKQ